MKSVKNRNPIAFYLCTNGLYKNKVFKNRRKEVAKFNLHKEWKKYE